jgi:hypothetical protein
VLAELWASGLTRQRKKCWYTDHVFRRPYSHGCSFYQEHIGKNLTDKYGKLSTAMDKLVNEANSEISAMQNKLTGRLKPDRFRHLLKFLIQPYPSIKATSRRNTKSLPTCTERKARNVHRRSGYMTF